VIFSRDVEIQPIKGDLQKKNKEADMSESNRSMPMREIPQSPAGEAAVLGSIMLSRISHSPPAAIYAISLRNL